MEYITNIGPGEDLIRYDKGFCRLQTIFRRIRRCIRDDNEIDGKRLMQFSIGK